MSSAPIAVPQMLSARTVARRLAHHRDWVLQRCRDGTFAGAYRDQGWRIPESSVLAYIERMREQTQQQFQLFSSESKRSAT